jgi:hypothetical protein
MKMKQAMIPTIHPIQQTVSDLTEAAGSRELKREIGAELNEAVFVLGQALSRGFKDASQALMIPIKVLQAALLNAIPREDPRKTRRRKNYYRRYSRGPR